MREDLNISEGIYMSLVSFVKIKNKSFKTAILEALSLIDYKFRNDVKKIVIKPNMCYYWDSTTGQTTDPKFIGALIDVLRDNFSPEVGISIVESDASAMKCKHAFKFLGYEKLSKEYNVRLVNLSEDAGDSTEVSAGGRAFRLVVPRTIQRADLRINVPKIKYASASIKITCALKNIFGCNPYQKKFRYHSRIDEAIVAINKAMKFDLCIVDGNIVLGTQPRRLGLVMASKDPVAIDAAAAEIAGVNPNSIGHLKLACKEGLGDIKFISKGMPLDYFKKSFPRKEAQMKVKRRVYATLSLLKLGKILGLE
jgi:uncharacterized protein (DUF362 family)